MADAHRSEGRQDVYPKLGFVAAKRRGPDPRLDSHIEPLHEHLADGQLLVIEWSGQLGEQQAGAAPKKAMPAFEHVLQPHATSPEDWQWRALGSPTILFQRNSMGVS